MKLVRFVFGSAAIVNQLPLGAAAALVDHESQCAESPVFARAGFSPLFDPTLPANALVTKLASRSQRTVYGVTVETAEGNKTYVEAYEVFGWRGLPPACVVDDSVTVVPYTGETKSDLRLEAVCDREQGEVTGTPLRIRRFGDDTYLARRDGPVPDLAGCQLYELDFQHRTAPFTGELPPAAIRIHEGIALTAVCDDDEVALARQVLFLDFAEAIMSRLLALGTGALLMEDAINRVWHVALAFE